VCELWGTELKKVCGTGSFLGGGGACVSCVAQTLKAEVASHRSRITMRTTELVSSVCNTWTPVLGVTQRVKLFCLFPSGLGSCEDLAFSRCVGLTETVYIRQIFLKIPAKAPYIYTVKYTVWANPTHAWWVLRGYLICVMGVMWISEMCDANPEMCDGCYVDIWDVWWVLRGYMYRTKYWNGYMYRTKYWNGIYQIITLLSNISVSALVNNPPLLHNSNVIEPHAKKRTKSSTGTKRKVPLTSSTTSTFMWLAIIKITQSAPQNHAINRFVQLNPHN